MTEIKFECPACGQHMECDRACGGDLIHCPRCCAELRIPFEDNGQIESTKRAELITPQTSTAAPTSAVAPTTGPAPVAEVPKPSTKPEHLEVTCPVCRSELKIAATGGDARKPGSSPPLAELLRKGPEPKPEAAPAQAQPESASDGQGKPEHRHLTIEEREQQIAAARQAHPIHLNPPMKPRLEYVLSGKTPPLVKEGQEAEAGRAAAKEKIEKIMTE